MEINPIELKPFFRAEGKAGLMEPTGTETCFPKYFKK